MAVVKNNNLLCFCVIFPHFLKFKLLIEVCIDTKSPHEFLSKNET